MGLAIIILIPIVLIVVVLVKQGNDEMRRKEITERENERRAQVEQERESEKAKIRHSSKTYEYARQIKEYAQSISELSNSYTFTLERRGVGCSFGNFNINFQRDGMNNLTNYQLEEFANIVLEKLGNQYRMEKTERIGRNDSSELCFTIYRLPPKTKEW